MSNSVTDELGIIYLAEELTVGQASPEETEVFKTKTLPLEKAVSMVLNGEIKDTLAVVGLLAAERLVSNR